MPAKQHVVRLAPAQRRELRAKLRAGTAAARVRARARVLLHVDAGVEGPRLTDAQVAAAVEVSPRMVARTRATFADHGLARTLAGKAPDRVDPRKLDGAAEATLSTLACSAPPEGHAAWSLRLLAGRLVALEVVDGISPETVRAALEKTSSSPG